MSVSKLEVYFQLLCVVSFLCRSVAVDSSNKVTVLQLDHKTEVLLQTSTTSFLLVREMFSQKSYNSSR